MRVQFPEHKGPLLRNKPLAWILVAEYARAVRRMIDVAYHVLQQTGWAWKRSFLAIKPIEIVAHDVYNIAYVHIDQNIHVVDAEKLQVSLQIRRRKYPIPSMQDVCAPGQLTDLLKSVQKQQIRIRG